MGTVIDSDLEGKHPDYLLDSPLPDGLVYHRERGYKNTEISIIVGNLGTEKDSSKPVGSFLHSAYRFSYDPSLIVQFSYNITLNSKEFKRDLAEGVFRLLGEDEFRKVEDLIKRNLNTKWANVREIRRRMQEGLKLVRTTPELEALVSSSQ